MNLIHTQNRINNSHQRRHTVWIWKIHRNLLRFFFSYSEDRFLFIQTWFLDMHLQQKTLPHCKLQFPLPNWSTFDYVSNIHSYRLLIEPEIALDFSILRFSEFQRTDILRIADDFRNSDEFDCWQWILYFQQP